MERWEVSTSAKHLEESDMSVLKLDQRSTVGCFSFKAEGKAAVSRATFKWTSR